MRFTSQSSFMANSTITSSDDGFNAEFNFTWKIKNFSHCLPGTWVRSPAFTLESMDKTRWCLQLMPKRSTNGAYLEYYLTREADKSGTRAVRVWFELSFLDCYGIQLVKKMQEASFKKDEFKGFTEFVEQAVVYTHRKYEYLPGNTLTACCRMKRIGRQPQKPVFCSSVSIIGVEQSSFYWNIKNFSKIRPGMLRSIRKRNPYIKVELSLTDKPEEALQFEISHAHVHKPNLINCEISVINIFSDHHTVYSKKNSKYLEGKVMEFPIFLKKSQLTTANNVYLRNDELVLKCDISISLGVISSVIDGYRSSSLEDEASSSSENEDCSSTVNEIISNIRQEIDILKSALKEERNVKEIKTREILEDCFSPVNESSISAQNENTYSTEDEIFGGFVNMKCELKPSFYNVESYSTENEDCSSTEDKIIPQIRQETGTLKKAIKEVEKGEEMKTKEIGTLKKDLKEVANVEEMKVKEIVEDFSHEDSSSSVKDSSFPAENEESCSTENEDCSSTEDEIIPKIRQETGTVRKALKEVEKGEEMKTKEIGTLKKDLKEVENFKEMKVKEIVEEFSFEDSSSSVNENSFPAENEESCSTEDETVGKFINKSFSMEETLTTKSVKNEIKRFYQNGTFSDINLTVEKETFLAHKLILSLKSPKFKEIFMNDLSKRSIKLPDLDPETLRDLLGFIYTSNVENMTWEKAQKLFLAAESYQVTSLKHLCLMFIKENINDSNACSVLVLASEQQNEELKQLAMEFIVTHGKKILTTKVWNEFAKKHINLAFETIQQMYLN